MYAPAAEYQRIRRPRPRPAWQGLVRRLVIGTAALGLLVFGLAHAAQGSAPSAFETVTVQPGDTLWAIAAERYPGADVRDKVGQIEHANGLDSPAIYSGEVLRVPAG